MSTTSRSPRSDATAERREALAFCLIVGTPSLLYWALLGYAAWKLAGWPGAAIAGVLIPGGVAFALSMARASGRCSRLEEGPLR